MRRTPIDFLSPRQTRRRPLRRPARVTQRRRAVMGDRRVQHVHQHRLVARRHQHHVGDRPEVGDVEGAVVGRAVVADQARPVHREGDVEALQADVVDDLVESALQEGRIDRADRLRALDRLGCARRSDGDARALRWRRHDDVERPRAERQERELGELDRHRAGLRLLYNPQAVAFHHQFFTFDQACRKALENSSARETFLKKEAGQYFLAQRKERMNGIRARIAKLAATVIGASS